jgi:hypothetical protein
LKTVFDKSLGWQSIGAASEAAPNGARPGKLPHRTKEA